MTGKGSPRRQKPLTYGRLERMAVHYLQRFPASTQRFRMVMNRKIRRAHERAPGPEDQYATWLETLEAACVQAGLLDDSALASGIAATQNRRGQGLRGIRAKLRSRGFTEPAIQAALETLTARFEARHQDPDLVAALRYAKRRRFGPFYAHELTWDIRRRQLASLARRGLSFGVCKRIMELSHDEAENMLHEENLDG